MGEIGRESPKILHHHAKRLRGLRQPMRRRYGLVAVDHETVHAEKLRDPRPIDREARARNGASAERRFIHRGKGFQQASAIIEQVEEKGG